MYFWYTHEGLKKVSLFIVATTSPTVNQLTAIFGIYTYIPRFRLLRNLSVKYGVSLLPLFDVSQIDFMLESLCIQ